MVMAQHTVSNSPSIFSAALLLCVSLAFPVASPAAEHFETPVGFAVSPTGAANFSISIEAPPGTAGMTPALSLNYNSQGGNGMLGMGWSLGGLSAIYRCGRTIIQDGANSGVSYTADDRFCLDGQRMVAVTGAYGANGTEYRTESESFTKIVSLGTAGSGPAYFAAWTKAGQYILFGNPSDSRIEAQGKTDVRVWAMNWIQDTVGNYMKVTYTENNVNGDYRPSRIDYTGNAAAGVFPFNSVRFVYEDRPDI